MQRVSQGNFKSCIHHNARCMRPPNITCLRQLQPCGTRHGEMTIRPQRQLRMTGPWLFASVVVKVQAEVCTVVDCGSSSCEFIRSTVNQARLVACLACLVQQAVCRVTWHLGQVPAYPSTANTAHIPMAVLTPFLTVFLFVLAYLASHTHTSTEVVCQPFAELTAFEASPKNPTNSSHQWT